jgi:hypothetical protein
MSGYFQRKTRDNGEVFFTFVDDRPDWVYDAVMEAHDGEMPDDWRFDICDSLFEEIDEDTDEDSLSEIVDGLVDVYNSDRVRWLAGNLNRASYVDEAVESFGVSDSPDVYNMIGMGQYVCIDQMAHIIFTAIKENAEVEEDDEEDEDDED